MPTKDDGDIAIEARDVEKTEEYATKQYFNKEGPMTKAASGILLGLGFLSLAGCGKARREHEKVSA